METKRKKILGLHPNVFFLGLVSFFTDVSSEMIFTLVPLFLTNVLGVSTTLVGLVGGVSDSTDALFRLISGRISDAIGKRKFLTALGYGLTAAVKPFMLLANGWLAVTGIRFGDRVGKGLRSSSRDALLADSLGPQERGRGFGLHRTMDTAGAAVGLAAVALIVYLLQGTGSFDMQSWQLAVGSWQLAVLKSWNLLTYRLLLTAYCLLPTASWLTAVCPLADGHHYFAH